MKHQIKKEFNKVRFFRPPFSRVSMWLGKILTVPKIQSPGLKVEKIKIQKKGRPRAVILTPESQNGQTIFYFHGGGFAYKAAPYHYALAKEYALGAQSRVILIDYLLSFEGEPLDSCLAAYKFFLERGGIDKNKICFAGDSAGGYLALALYDLCRKEALALPKKIMLVYSVIDPLMQSQSMKKFTDTPMWNAKLNRKMWKFYSKERKVFNPLEAEYEFPLTYLETAEFDCLHDEGVLFAEKLAGSVQLNETRGTIHGYDICQKAPTTQNSVEKRIEFLRK